MESPWTEVCEIVEAVTGRPVIGTDGGEYLYTHDAIYVPGVESALHELCHWTVATESERRRDNYGLTQNWREGGDAFCLGVLREEEVFSLQFFIMGDISIERFGRIMTCEANATCSPVTLCRHDMRSPVPPMSESSYLASRDPGDARWLANGMVARTELAYEIGLVRGDNIRPDGTESRRRHVLRCAERVGLPVDRLRDVARRWIRSVEPTP